MANPLSLPHGTALVVADKLAGRVVRLEEALQEIVQRGDRRSARIARRALGLKKKEGDK